MYFETPFVIYFALMSGISIPHIFNNSVFSSICVLLYADAGGNSILISDSCVVFRVFRDFPFPLTRTSGPRYPPQFDRKKISEGWVSLLGGSQIKNPEEEERPFKLQKSINFGGCSSRGWFFLRVLGLETTQQIHSLGGGGFLQSNTHNQF